MTSDTISTLFFSFGLIAAVASFLMSITGMRLGYTATWAWVLVPEGILVVLLALMVWGNLR